jgi:hypothetical protein
MSDPANQDPDLSAGGEHGFIGKAVVQYNIIFETEPQLKEFYTFIRLLKKQYPEERTIGGRIAAYIRGNFTPATDEADPKNG